MKIQVLSDVHLISNRKKEKNNLPITFFLLYQQIKEILSHSPDIIIINGDIIDNQAKIDVTILNFLSSLFNYIYQQNKNIKIFLNQGNHDILFVHNSIQNYGSFVNIFKNNINVIPITENRKISVLNDLNLFLIPYTMEQEEIYKFIEEEKNYTYGLYFLHQDIDILHNYYNFSKQSNSTSNKKILEFDKFKAILEKITGYYYILNGHYHFHNEYNNKKLIVLGSLYQSTYQESISTINNIDKYFGWCMIDFKNKNNVEYNFYPFVYGIYCLKYENKDIFEKEYDQLKSYISSNIDKKYFQIRVVDSTDVIAEKTNINEKICQLEKFNNVLEQKYIKLFTIDMNNSSKQTINKYFSNDTNKFNIEQYYINEITKMISGSNSENYLKEILFEFNTLSLASSKQVKED